MHQERARCNGEQHFLIEGRLTNLHWELGSENLLAKVSQHYKENAILSGAGAVVGDMFGQVASSAMLAMYDGEDTQNFICLINDQVACGQFGGAELLPEGENIKAVVSRGDDFLYVHAVMDEAKRVVWIKHPLGSRAEMWANLKVAFFVFLAVNAGFSLFWLMGGKNGFFDNIKFSLITGAGISLILALWSIKDIKLVADRSTECFRLLGFESPESVNLNFPYHYRMQQDYIRRGERVPNSWYSMSGYQYRNVYSVEEAVEAGKARLRSSKCEKTDC